MNEKLAAARSYAEREFRVIPNHTPMPDGGCSCQSKAACTSPGKHPRITEWEQRATTDPAIIDGWWKRWPSANVGLLTGIAFDVLDLDGPEAEGLLPGPLPDGPKVITSRGSHHYFAPTGAGCKTKVGGREHVDYRGLGGQVIAPPSDRRRWDETFGPDWPLRAVPPWLAALVGAPSVSPGGNFGRAALENEIAKLAGATEGARNDTLNKAAFALGQLVGSGDLDEGEVIARLNDTAVGIGLDPQERARTIASGIRAGMAKPRAVRPGGSFGMVEQLAADDPLLVVNTRLGINLTAVRRVIGDDVRYVYVGEREVEVTPDQFFDWRRARSAINAATNVVIPRFRAGQWDDILRLFCQAATDDVLGPEATSRGRMRAYLRSYLSAWSPETVDPSWPELLPQTFVENGRVHVVGSKFKRWVRTTHDERLRATDFPGMMMVAGCEAVGDDVWMMPLDLDGP